MKCWYCNKYKRISSDNLFCKRCSKLKSRPITTQTLIIYDKI